MGSISLAIIPGTTFKNYQYALAKKLNDRGVDVRVISAFRFHLTEAKLAGIPPINSNIRGLFSIDCDDSISDVAIDEDTKAFRAMFRYRSSYRFLYRKLVPWYRKLFQEAKITCLLIFNGSKIYQRAAIRAAETEKIQIIYFENGYLPKTMQVDSRGINFSNSLKLKYGKSRDSVKLCSYEDLRNLSKSNVCTDEIQDDRSSTTRGFEWWWSIGMDLLIDPLIRPWIWRPKVVAHFLASRRRRAPVQPIGGPLPSRYLLLVLQVECDSQHVLYSPLFRSMREAIRICIEARDKEMPDIPIVVRPHPAEPRPWLALEKVEEASGAMWDEITPLDSAIERAEIVCTINSSVGFQALMAGKRVFALGEACYALPMVCPGAVDLGSAAAALRAAMELDVNNPERMKFLTFAAKEYFVYDSWSHLTESGLENTTVRILKELGEQSSES